MGPSLSHRERLRPLSNVSLRSCSEATNSPLSASETPPWSDEEMAVRTLASSAHSVTSNRSSRSQQRKTRIRGSSSSVYSVTSNRSSRSLGSITNNNGRRRRPESYSPSGSGPNQSFTDSNKRFLLYARIAMLIFILLNLTKSPYGVNHEQLAAATAMTIYTQATQPKLNSEALSHGRTPRFLFGIFSTLRPQDLVRRNGIRRTYLASDKYRICSLKELPNKPYCQIVYTFVVGANATGATDLVDNPPSHLTVNISEHPILDANGDEMIMEEDVTYLNLQENMEYGKSPSWFLYANTLVDDLGVDFIAKVDSDTLVFPNRFLDEFATFLPTKNHSYAINATNQDPHPTSELMVYGGIPNDSIGCGGLRRPHCAQMGGKTYMQGQLHFLSADLSRYVTSIPREIRRDLFVPIEDLCTAKYVHSHSKPILEAVVSPQQHLWEHGKHIKDPQSYENRWNQVMQEMQTSSVGRGTGGAMRSSGSRVGLSG
jgi:hypothetical protein